MYTLVVLVVVVVVVVVAAAAAFQQLRLYEMGPCCLSSLAYLSKADKSYHQQMSLCCATTGAA